MTTPATTDRQIPPATAADIDRQALADLLGAVLTGLARMAASAGDTNRYSASVGVLSRFLDGSLLAATRS